MEAADNAANTGLMDTKMAVPPTLLSPVVVPREQLMPERFQTRLSGPEADSRSFRAGVNTTLNPAWVMVQRGF